MVQPRRLPLLVKCTPLPLLFLLQPYGSVPIRCSPPACRCSRTTWLYIFGTRELPNISGRVNSIQGLPDPSSVRQGHPLRHRLPGIEPRGRVWPTAGPGPGRPAPPARHRALRGAAQRAAPCRRHHLHRTPDPALARQPARRAERHPQRLHPRHPRRPCHRAPHRQLRPLRGDRGRMGNRGGHQGGSR